MTDHRSIEIVTPRTKLADLWSRLLPAILFLIVFFVVPLAAIILLSLSPNVLVHFSGYGLQNFIYFFSKSYYVGVLLRTVSSAIVTTIVALVIGYPAAYCLTTVSGRIGNALLIALTFPILAGPLAVVLGWMILLPDGGPLLRPLIAARLIGPLHLIGTQAAIIIGLVHFSLPFVILTLYSSLKQIPNDLIEAAQSLGAGWRDIYVRIIFPLSLPGVISAAIIAFSLTASAYVAPHYLGGPTQLTLTTLVSEFILGTYNNQMAATISVLLLGTMSLVTFVFMKFTTRLVR